MKGIGNVVGIVCIAISLTFYATKGVDFTPAPSPSAQTDGIILSPRESELAKPITEALKPYPKKASYVAGLYSSLAQFVEDGSLNSKSQVRQAYTTAQSLLIADLHDMPTPGLSEAVEKALEELIGLEDSNLSKDERAKVVRGLRVVSQAAGISR